MSIELERNKEIVFEFWRRLSKGDGMALENFDAAMQLVEDDAPWWIQSGAEGQTHYKPAMRGQWMNSEALYETRSFKCVGVTAEGRRVALEAEGLGKLRDGRPWRQTYHFLFEVENGKIQKIREYMDTHYMYTMLMGGAVGKSILEKSYPMYKQSD
jgi:ketosteroid isomerase-like protein